MKSGLFFKPIGLNDNLIGFSGKLEMRRDVGQLEKE
jgi:hypothetical protein